MVQLLVTYSDQKLFVVKYQHAVSGSGEPEGDLEAAIVRDFGSVAAMKEKLSASTVAVQVRLELDVVRSKVLFPHILSSNTRAPDGAGLGTTRLLGSCKSPLVPTRCTNISSTLRLRQRNIFSLTNYCPQDPLEATTGLVPLFGIDVWEHAYYLQVSFVWLRVVKLEFIFCVLVQECPARLCEGNLRSC